MEQHSNTLSFDLLIERYRLFRLGTAQPRSNRPADSLTFATGDIRTDVRPTWVPRAPRRSDVRPDLALTLVPPVHSTAQIKGRSAQYARSCPHAIHHGIAAYLGM